MGSCGYHLRGTGELELSHSKVFLMSQTPYNELEKKLKINFISAGALMVDDLNGADVQVRLLSLNFEQLGASRDRTGRANEVVLRADLKYQLILSRDIQLKRELKDSASVAKVNEKDIQVLSDFPLKTLRVSRSFYQNYTNPVGEKNQLKDTHDEIYSELALLLSRQIEVIMSR